jgi:hypothetical protein
MENTITPQQAVLLMERSKGRIFSIMFIKKNGDERLMSCRKHVTKGVKGVGLKYDALKKSLMTVYDMHKQGFRSVNINTLRAIKINGESFNINNQN